MKPITALSLFNGISGLHLALDRAEIPINKVYYSEIDKFANQVTEHHYPNDIALGDVTKWEDWDIDWSSIDLVSAGFPCFTKGNSVLTQDGYKDISEIVIGDVVMTHKNRWKAVTNTFAKVNKVYKVKAQGLLETLTTEEHPFLVSEMTRVDGKRVFSTPNWVEVKNLKSNHFVCYPKILKEVNELNITKDEAYIIGRYIADGHTSKHKRKEVGRENQRYWNLILSVGSHKIPTTPIKHCINKHTKNTTRMVFSNKRLVEIAEKYCGCGAVNKFIHPSLLELPKDILEELVNGILDGDGSCKDGVYKLTSVSKELIMSLNLAIMKLYAVVGSVVYTKRPKTTIIEGRTVNQRDTYTISFTKDVRKQKKYEEIKDYFLAPIKVVEGTDTVSDVFNIEVQDDNSYTINNCIVHNCQAWSVAGKQLGDKDERGMLFWTTLDIIKKVLDNNPNAKFLMENVKMKKEFEEYITYHTEQSLGYVEKILINSALVSAQNRNRYYWTNFKIEELPKDKGILLKDMLYFDEYFKRPCKVKSGFTMNDNGLIHVANATDLGNIHESAKRVYHQDGKSPTLNTCGGGNLESKVLVTDFLVDIKNNAINKYETLYYRKLTPIEYERLQNVPDNFTSMLSKTQRYKCLGNGWTIDVIAHILKYAFEK